MGWGIQGMSTKRVVAATYYLLSTLIDVSWRIIDNLWNKNRTDEENRATAQKTDKEITAQRTDKEDFSTEKSKRGDYSKEIHRREVYKGREFHYLQDGKKWKKEFGPHF